MSFDDARPTFPSPSAPPSPSISPAHPNPTTSELRGLLAALSANNAALRRLSSSGLQDASSLRRLRDLRAQNRELARVAAALSDRLPAGAPLRAEFHAVIVAFGDALKASVDQEKRALSFLRGGTGAVGGANGALRPATETTPLLVVEEESELQAQVETQEGAAAVVRELRSNDALRRERDAAMRQVQASVDDVNAIFKDLAVMVGEQSAQVDYVELQLGDAAVSVGAARRELDRAHARGSRRKKLFFMTLMSVALIVALFLIILLS
jgi:hypothetical protein